MTLLRWPNLREALAEFSDRTIEIVTRVAGLLAFNSSRGRWVVERTLAWLNRNRRLPKDFETSIASATTWIYIRCHTASHQEIDGRIVQPMRF
jgi:transposase